MYHCVYASVINFCRSKPISIPRLWKKSGVAFAVLSLGLLTAACVTLPVDVLDRYVGFYYLDPFMITVTRNAEQLSIQMTGGPAREIRPVNETTFAYKGRSISAGAVEFLSDGEGSANALVWNDSGAKFTAMRSNEATAEQINTNFTARVRANVPTPGSEAALLNFIDGIINGAPNYSDMTPEVAEAMNNVTQHPRIRRFHQEKGSIQTVDWRGVGAQGGDIYEIRYENGVLRWDIVLRADGKLAFISMNTVLAQEEGMVTITEMSQ